MTNSSAGPAIRARNLGKRFMIGVRTGNENFLNTTRRLVTGWTSQRELWALRNVSFDIDRGETFGIIGPNGAGKSTLLLLLAEILAPTEGRCAVSSKTHCFFRLGAALQPRLTVLENFSLCSALLGLDRGEFRRRLPAMVAFSGLEDYLYAKYGELSSGLAARLPFSAAIHTDLEIILVDEMLMVGDQNFQAKCLKTFQELKARGKTLVMVSHNLQQIQALCSRALYLNAGKTAFLGDTAGAVRMHVRDMGGGSAGRTPRGERHTEELLDAGVKNIHRGLKAALYPGGRPPAAPGDESDELLLAEIRRTLRSELSRIRSELGSGAGDDRGGTAVPRPASAPEPREERVPLSASGAEDAWRRLLGHSGPLAVCGSVQAAFGAVIRSLMAGPGKGRLKPGDEVIMTAGRWAGAARGLISRGLVPVFVDLDPETFNMDVKQLARALSPRTRAVMLSHGSTCGPVDGVAEFCSANGLYLVDFVYSAGLAGRYGGSFLGTTGDFGIYSPGRPDSAWSLALARDPASGLLEQLLPAARDTSGPALPDPVRAAGPGLSASLDACGKWELQLADLEAGFAEYSDFFGALPDCFAALKPPPAARLAPLFFTLLVKRTAPFTVRDLIGAGIENKARHGIIETPAPRSAGTPQSRRLNELPNTMEMCERGVVFPVLRGARERARFLEELGGWLRNR